MEDSMDFEITIAKGAAQIKTPYNADFVSKIRMVGGAKWDAEKRRWIVPETAVPAVREIMRDVYGRDDLIEGETISVRLTFAETLERTTTSVIIMGHTISRAYGRDSGANPGDGVSFVQGECFSSGSARNWSSGVKGGSVVIIDKVPIALYEREKDNLPRGVTCEIVKNDYQKSYFELKDEKARLLARIAEIDKMLAEIEAANG